MRSVGTARGTARCVPRGRCGCGRTPVARAGFPVRCGSTLEARQGRGLHGGPVISHRGRAGCPHPPAPPHWHCDAVPERAAAATVAGPVLRHSPMQSRPAAAPQFLRYPATGWAGAKPAVSCRSQDCRSTSNVWHITPHDASLHVHPLLYTRAK